jgi:LURP-one-related
VGSGNLSSPEKEGEYMGLFRRGDDGGRRFVMREKLLSIGDDFWIRDDDGNKVYKVNGKALRVRKTLVLEDDSGNELVHIQDRVLNVRGTMKLQCDGARAPDVAQRRAGRRAGGRVAPFLASMTKLSTSPERSSSVAADSPYNVPEPRRRDRRPGTNLARGSRRTSASWLPGSRGAAPSDQARAPREPLSTR